MGTSALWYIRKALKNVENGVSNVAWDMMFENQYFLARNYLIRS